MTSDIKMAASTPKNAFRLKLSLALQSRQVAASAARIGFVGSLPVLWKWQRRRPHSFIKQDAPDSSAVQVPPVATLSQLGCSQTGRRRLVAKLKEIEFDLTLFS